MTHQGCGNLWQAIVSKDNASERVYDVGCLCSPLPSNDFKASLGVTLLRPENPPTRSVFVLVAVSRVVFFLL
uniref:Uncharacterized protein n=2 Tax=Anguilla anguilla TaxID=7936 RepID=A0A0E9VX50_ANGAN